MTIVEFDTIERLLRDEDLAGVTSVLSTMSVAEILAAMRRLRSNRQALLYRLLDKDVAMAVFERLAPAVQTELVAGLRDEELVSLVEDLDPDDRVLLFDELPAQVADRLLHGLSPQERRLTTPMLGYPQGSTGRRMSPEYVRVKPTMTVAETLDRVRRVGSDVETVYTLMVTDEVRHLVGVVALDDVVLASESTPIGEIYRETASVTAISNAEDAARLCADLRAIALPVVDSEQRLIGILSIDDALTILEDAESEDAARAGGAEPLRRPYLSTPIHRLVRARTVWLLVLAVSAMLTVGVLERFEATLGEAVVLALFIPLLTGIGGNTGSQAASTLTRALAVADVRPADIGRVVMREAQVGLTMGAVLGALGWCIATPIYGVDIGNIIALTLLSVCTIAAVVGGAMPLLAKTLRVDPAVFSTPFISTFCDATGLLIYFTIASAILGLGSGS
ncbi:magnesium transporter [Antricoccus suffuscus]|uniref:Magnesium transporter MgtE n=1 Tax=Antricoccus suffuscus TaxID=1629062 RepID=A0A2T1A3M2_9ACTN|nr:magnesium transporter [Antricoccus suffuscus]PRZ43134.1 magnesium transporter [Antricoccus suffuscus]